VLAIVLFLLAVLAFYYLFGVGGVFYGAVSSQSTLSYAFSGAVAPMVRVRASPQVNVPS
jgi:hypothetical protein